MKIKVSVMPLIRSCAVLCFAAFAAYGAPVLYTFTATTRATQGSPSHAEQFQLTVPDFLPLVENGAVLSFLRDDPALISCVSCAEAPVSALHFLRSGGTDLVQFRDADGILRPYFFPLNALAAPGTYETLPGINVAVGKLVVAEIPEPAAFVLGISGLAVVMLFGALRSRLV